MPRQTNQKAFLIPDGCNFAIDVGNGFEDVGILAGGVSASLGWDNFYMDAGNYEGLVDRMKNPTFAVNPSALLNWDPQIIAKCLPGVLSSAAAVSPATGFDVTYAGTSNQVTVTRSSLRLTYFPDDKETFTMSSSVTAVDNVSNNQMVTVPLFNLIAVLGPTATKIDGYIFIPTMTEVSYADRDLIANRGNFYTDAGNLYIIVTASLYADTDAADSALDDTVISFWDNVDWQFTFYNAAIDGGATFNFKGVNEDGLDEITVSYTGRADPANSYQLLNLFIAD